MYRKVLSKDILLPLSWIRAAALALQLIYLFWLGNSPVPAVWVIMVLQLLVLINQFLYRKAASQRLLLGYLVADAVLLAGYVYFTGGASNPLISLLLLPVITGSVLLGFKSALSILIVVNSAYALIWWFNQSAHTHMHHGYGNHLIGMWLVFAVTSALIFFVVSSLSRINDRQQTLINRQRQRQIRDEHIMALGLSAADAAHQLNTPLSTLAVSLEDISEQEAEDQAASVMLMQEQIARCNEITRNMSAQYKQLSRQEFQNLSVKDLLVSLTSKYRLIHPQTFLKVEGNSQTFENLKVRSHLGLVSAFLNVLDNAAKASQAKNKDSVLLKVGVKAPEDSEIDYIYFHIIDYGKGLETSLFESYGHEPAQFSEQGMGIGTLVTSASIERVGGRLSIENHKDGGAKVSVFLPLVK